ncbi:MAG: hypothetical protein ACRCZZ_06070 [Phocaeicola sp.]
MSEKTIRLNKVAREFNLGLHTIVEFLNHNGVAVESSPNSKITEEAYAILAKEFGNEQTIKDKAEAKKTALKKQEAKTIEEERSEKELIIKSIDAPIFSPEKPKLEGPKVVKKINLDAPKPKKTKEVKEDLKTISLVENTPKEAKKTQKEIEIIAQPIDKISVKVVDKITLEQPKAKKKKTESPKIKENTSQTEAAVGSPIEEPKVETPEEKPFRQEDAEFLSIQVDKLSGPIIKDKIDLTQFKPSDLDSRPGK